MATPWETLLIRSANRSSILEFSDHLNLSQHPNIAVRLAWASRNDIPESLAVRRALGETDQSVLWQLIDNPAISSSAIALLAQHHPDRLSAMRAACSPHCPDEIAASVLLYRVRTMVKHRLAAAWAPFSVNGTSKNEDQSFNDGILMLRNRPQTLFALAQLLPVKQIKLMAQVLRLYPESFSSFTGTLLRRSHGADDQSNLHLVAALMLADAKPSKRTRHLARLRGGPLLAWVNLHDGDGNDIFNQFDFTQIASQAGEYTAGLIINRSSAESSQKVLLQASLNPALSNHLVASIIQGTSIAKEVVHSRSVQWDVGFVKLLGRDIQAALDTDASLLHTRVSDSATLNEVAMVCRSPRSQRLVAGHPLCSVETALHLPAGSALEAFHDPGTLHKQISDKVGGAADAASTLSVEFNGSLSELIFVAKGLIHD